METTSTVDWQIAAQNCSSHQLFWSQCHSHLNYSRFVNLPAKRHSDNPGILLMLPSYLAPSNIPATRLIIEFALQADHVQHSRRLHLHATHRPLHHSSSHQPCQPVAVPVFRRALAARHLLRALLQRLLLPQSLLLSVPLLLQLVLRQPPLP